MALRGLCAGVSGGINGATGTFLTSVLSLPGSAVAGDVVVVACSSATGSNTATAVINGHSLTARSSPVTQSSTLRGYLFTYTLVAGDIGNNLTITWTGSSARCLASGIVMSGVDENSIQIGAAFGQTTGNITPPAITVSAGTAADVVIVAISRTNSTTVVATYTPPSGYGTDVYAKLAISTAPEQASYIGHLTAPALGSTTITPGAIVIGNSPTNSLTWTIGMQKVTLARSASDSASPADGVTQAISLHAVASDTASASDSAGENFTASRGAADTASPADAATRAGAASRAAIDTVSASDVSAHGPVSASRTASDAASPADAAGRSWTYARTASDTASQTDSAARAQSSARPAGDTASPADAASRSTSRNRTASDTATPSDTASAAFAARARAATDTATPADAAARAQTSTRTASQPSTASDTAGRAGASSRTAADTATPTDSASRAPIALGRFILEPTTAADLASRAETQARAALDVASPNDTVGVYRVRELDLVVVAAPDRFALSSRADRFALAGVPDRFHLAFKERTP